MHPKILRINVFTAMGCITDGGLGAGPQPPEANGGLLGKFWHFLAKITPLVIIFDQIHQKIILRLSENIQNFD